MLTCRELVQERASDYLDKQLNWHQRIGVRFHLLICDHCSRFIRQLKRLRKMLAHRPEPPVSESEVTAVADRLYRLHQHGGHRPE
jgi:predicted anti-sigma-YlaC factor YlaD